MDNYALNGMVAEQQFNGALVTGLMMYICFVLWQIFDYYFISKDKGLLFDFIMFYKDSVIALFIHCFVLFVSTILVFKQISLIVTDLIYNN